MKDILFKSALALAFGVCWSTLSSAQSIEISPKLPNQVQQQSSANGFVLKVTDSISRIRVAKMESNNAMPGSKLPTESFRGSAKPQSFNGLKLELPGSRIIKRGASRNQNLDNTPAKKKAGAE